MKQLSVIVVNYNVKEYLKDCIQGCLNASRNFDAEILVVDNASSDGSRELITSFYPEIRWIQNEKNLGFSRANNIGFKESSGKYVLFLNPDVYVPEDIFDQLIPFAEENKGLGALGVRITDEYDMYRPESKRNLPNPVNTFNKLFSYLNPFRNSKEIEGYYNNKVGEKEIGEVEVLTGAFFFIPRIVYEKTGGFDERYFMYGEDIDLSYTILKQGYKNYYFGKSTVVHYKGKSTTKNKIYYQRFFGAMEIFIKKYYKRPFCLYIFLFSGLKIRYYLALFIDRLKK